MRHLAEIIHADLRWVQPRVFDRAYELRHGDERVATLAFRSAFGSFAAAAAADGSWTFKRVDFWQRRATVRVEGGTDDLAVLEHDTWNCGGTLTLAGGRSSRVTTNLWQSKIEFLAADDTVLFRYLTEGFLRQESQFEVMPPLLRMPEMPSLILFGWYLVVMLHQDSSSRRATSSHSLCSPGLYDFLDRLAPHAAPGYGHRQWVQHYRRGRTRIVSDHSIGSPPTRTDGPFKRKTLAVVWEDMGWIPVLPRFS